MRKRIDTRKIQKRSDRIEAAGAAILKWWKPVLFLLILVALLTAIAWAKLNGVE